MKKAFILCCLSVFIYCLFLSLKRIYPVEGTLTEQNVSFDSVQKSEHPTQEEWLEVYLTHKIKQTTDIHARRTAVVVSIVSKAKSGAIVITLTPSELPLLSKNAIAELVEQVEDIAKHILEEYGWAKNYKLTVQYI